jgi:hypothetical protein
VGQSTQRIIDVQAHLRRTRVKASELIQQLRDYMTEHGDLPVTFEEDPDREVESVEFYKGDPAFDTDGDTDCLMVG